ncbi:MAG: GspE/PulE family protein, partial [Phycisphaerales bacterium]|nr:GspE/PulE family protein [Phycisphaerales bacterium]
EDELELIADDDVLDDLEVLDDEPIPMIESIAAAYNNDDGEPESAISMLRRIADNIPNKEFDTDKINLINARGQTIMEESKRDRSENLQLFRIILLICFRTGASDIHLESRPEDFLMRMRIDGSLIDLTSIDMPMGIKLCAIIKLLCDLDTTQKTIVQEGHFAARVPMSANTARRPGIDTRGRRVDYRVSFVPTLYGQKLVIRVFDTVNAPAMIDDLQLPTQMSTQISKQLQLGSNIVLVCGPTGSGKTTTLYALLRSCGLSNRNILTIEDPVEVQLVGTTQLPVDDANGKSFAALLRSSLRQDPDVIMVGEIRDPETAQIALQAAITGHLVFSSVHTRDTVGTVFRLLDLGCEPFMVAQGLRIVLAQRLIRKLCVNCRRPYTPSAADLAKLGPAGANVKKLYSPAGCAHCLGSGFAGRQGIFELLHVDDKIRDAITHHPTASAIRELLAEQNFVTLMQSGYQLVAQGITSFDEVEHAAG